MNRSQHRISILKSCAAIVLVFALWFPMGCGNEDFQRPIQQFQSASAVVIAAARQSLQQMNDVEEKSELNRQIFEAEAFDESKIKAKDVISADELNARVNALDQLTRYTSALADLAALKAPAQVTQKFQDVGSGFATLSKDAEKLVGKSGSFFDNPKFSGAVQVATAGIGAIGAAGAIRSIGERGLEHTLQLSRLVAGQLAAGDFALNEVVDLRFEIGGRWLGAARLVAGLARLQRGIDIRQRRRQRALIGGTDGT
jgi:hypothetical protein